METAITPKSISQVESEIHAGVDYVCQHEPEIDAKNKDWIALSLIQSMHSDIRRRWTAFLFGAGSMVLGTMLILFVSSSVIGDDVVHGRHGQALLIIVGTMMMFALSATFWLFRYQKREIIQSHSVTDMEKFLTEYRRSHMPTVLRKLKSI